MKSDIRRKFEQARRMLEDVEDLIDQADPDAIWIDGASLSPFMGELDDAIDCLREFEVTHRE